MVEQGKFSGEEKQIILGREWRKWKLKERGEEIDQGEGGSELVGGDPKEQYVCQGQKGH